MYSEQSGTIHMKCFKDKTKAAAVERWQKRENVHS